MPVHIAESLESLASECCNWIVGEIRLHHSNSRRPFSLALSGGSTPKVLYGLLSRADVDWDNVRLLWGDERNVPVDHPDSNYRMVKETLLERITIPSENILEIPDPGGNAKESAAKYERLLQNKLPKTETGWPLIDCVLLGLGDDVHTASLFPATAALLESTHCVAANFVPKLNTWRITLTAPAINSAKRVAFLISGSNKAQALDHLWAGPRDSAMYPAQLIEPHSGSVDYFVDRAALGSLAIPAGL